MKRHEIKKRPLSDTTLASLEPESKLYNVKDSGNLYFQVKPTGAKSWIMRYKKANGVWGWHGLGGYPMITGAMARKIYQDKLLQLSQGAEILTAKPSSPDSQTFKTIALEWYNEPKTQALGDDTKKKYLELLEKHVFPVMGNKDMATISRKAWLDFFRELQTRLYRGKPIIEQSNRALQLCSRIYRFARDEQLAGVAFNPLDNLHERMAKHESEQMKHVAESDLPPLLNAIDNIPSDITRLGVKLLSHLFLRPNEVLDGFWHEIDFDNAIWEIPAERMKKKRTHVVPLSNQVLAMLQALRAMTGANAELFPCNAKNTKNKHQRFRVALKRQGYKGKQTLHGFRHIASTKLNNYTGENGQKFDERVIEFALAHKVTGVKGVYNKAEYLDDRRALNQWYSNWLDSLQGKNDE